MEIVKRKDSAPSQMAEILSAFCGIGQKQDESGLTLLMIACMYGQWEIAEVLLPHSDPRAASASGENALSFAFFGCRQFWRQLADSGSLPAVILLIIEASDPSERNNRGESAVLAAQRCLPAKAFKQAALAMFKFWRSHESLAADLAACAKRAGLEASDWLGPLALLAGEICAVDQAAGPAKGRVGGSGGRL